MDCIIRVCDPSLTEKKQVQKNVLVRLTKTILGLFEIPCNVRLKAPDLFSSYPRRLRRDLIVASIFLKGISNLDNPVFTVAMSPIPSEHSMELKQHLIMADRTSSHTEARTHRIDF